MNLGGGYCHFSVDDTIKLFEDITLHENEYDSVFENPTLCYFKMLHDKFGLKVSFFVFYRDGYSDDSFTLADVTNKFASEFAANSDWLRFGFHARDWKSHETMTVESEQEAYEKTYSELLRITGSNKAIDTVLRLDYYEAERDCVEMLIDKGVKGLLTADDHSRDSYDLSNKELIECYLSDILIARGVFYTPTDIRIENIANDNDFYENFENVYTQERVIVFTHERFLSDIKVKKYIYWFASFANQVGIDFAFPAEMELFR